MFGNVIVVILAVVFRAGTFPIVIHTIIVYSILLPLAFLMNTSHNKTRILEYGWRNVLRNLLGMKQQTQEAHANSVSGRIQNVEQPAANERNSNNTYVSKVFNTRKAPETTKTNITCGNWERDSKSKRKIVEIEEKPLTDKMDALLNVYILGKKLQRYNTAPQLIPDIVQNTVKTKKYSCPLKRHHEFKLDGKNDIFLIDLEQVSDFVFNDEPKDILHCKKSD